MSYIIHITRYSTNDLTEIKNLRYRNYKLIFHNLTPEYREDGARNIFGNCTVIAQKATYVGCNKLKA